MEEDKYKSITAPTRLVLHAYLCRYQKCRHRLCSKRVVSQVNRWRCHLAKDRYRAAEREAGEQRSGARERYRAAVDEIRFEIHDQVLRLETLDRQMGLYDQVLVPQAESALQSAETAYETGLVGSTELLESERVLFDIRLTQTRFTADYLQALGRLELSLGTRFPDF